MQGLITIKEKGENNMKKMMILAVMMVMTISANAMSYNAAKNEALFLSDKMAYELNLTAAQYEAVYEINLDYLMSLNGHGDVFGIWWDRRNADLRFYAGRHMPKPAVHHPAPPVHRHAPAPAPHHGKPAATHNNRHGSDRHMAMNTSRGNGGHFRMQVTP